MDTSTSEHARRHPRSCLSPLPPTSSGLLLRKFNQVTIIEIPLHITIIIPSIRSSLTATQPYSQEGGGKVIIIGDEEFDDREMLKVGRPPLPSRVLGFVPSEGPKHSVTTRMLN